MDVTYFYIIPEVLLNYRFYKGNTSKKQADKMHSASKAIKLETCDKHPFLHDEFIREFQSQTGTRFRLRLFNKIPLIKIKNDWICLFEFIPIIKIKWK